MTPLPEMSVIGIFELFRELLNFIIVMIHDEANLDEMRVRDGRNYPGVARPTAPWGCLSGRHGDGQDEFCCEGNDGEDDKG